VALGVPASAPGLLITTKALRLVRRGRERKGKERKMRLSRSPSILLSLMPILLLGSTALADVFNMPGGLTSLEFVTVGNPGNAGDTRYATPGYGAVDYAYNIGEYEVTAGQYCEFLNAVAAEDTYGLYSPNMDTAVSSFGCNIKRTGSSGSYTYSVASDWADRPVNYVSWGDAARFANWLHNGQPTGAQGLTTTEDGAYFLNGATTDAQLMAVTREPDWKWAITSEDEWYKAAYHKNDGITGNYFDYPTSSNSPPGYVNNGGNLSTTGTPFVEGGTDPGNYATFDGDYEASGIGSPYYRTEVGEWENSGSPYGTFDQGGNVWEWNEAVIVSYRGLRGGSFDGGGSISVYALHASSRYDVYPTYEIDFIGFRVCEVPEPATLLLLAIGGPAILRRRRPRRAC
jgi:formylglycine-generating enzyme required for sulfatase activity